MARILAIANTKGGVGKTTTAVNLASALVERGHRVLAVDLDPQSSLTISVGFNPDNLFPTIREVLDGTYIFTAILNTAEGWHLIPSNEKLESFETRADRQQIFALTSALEGVKAVYDFILLDCPAGAGILTGMALLSADEVVIPLTPDFLSYRSLASLMRIIHSLRQRSNPKLRIAGLFLTMYDSRTRHARDILTALRNTYGGEIPFFSAVVRNSVRLKEAPVVGQSVIKYAPQSQAAQAFRQIATELEQGLPQPVAPEEVHPTLADSGPVPTIVQFVSGENEDVSTLPSSAAPAVSDDVKPVDGEVVVPQINRSEPTNGEKETPFDPEMEATIGNASAASVPQLLELAQWLDKTGQRPRAARVFARITELDPRNTLAWMGRANTTGSVVERLEYIQRCLEIRPDDPSAKTALLAARAELRTGATRVVREFERRQKSVKAGETKGRVRQAVEYDWSEDALSLRPRETEGPAKALLRRHLALVVLSLGLVLILLLLILFPWLSRL